MNVRRAFLATIVLLACWPPVPGIAAAAAGGAPPPIKDMSLQQLLAEFHDPAAELRLSKPPPQRWTDLINALRNQSDALLPLLKTDLVNGDPKTRTRALRVLAQLGNRARPAIPELLIATADPDESIRDAAVWALGPLKDPRAFLVLTAALHDPSLSVRLAVVRSARPSMADGSFAMMALALGDKDKLVRQSALQELKLFGDKRAVPYIAPSLDDVEVLHHETRDNITLAYRNCDAAVEALEKVVNRHYIVSPTGTQADQDRAAEHWRRWWKDNGERFTKDLDAEPELKRALD